MRSEQGKDTHFLPEKLKWQFVCQISGDSYVLSKREKGQPIYTLLSVYSFPFLHPKKLVDAEKFNLHYPKPEMLITTADKLRYYRYQKSLLQREVAEYAGINESTYIDYESGKRECYPIDKIQRIAELLEVPTEALLDEYNLFLCEQSKTLKALRERCGWTQSKLAERLSVRLHVVKQWEQGRVRMTRKMWGRVQKLLEKL